MDHKTRNFKVIAVLAFAFTFIPTLVFAQLPFLHRENFSLFLGARTWVSNGSSEFTIAGPGGVPNIISELKWADVDSVVFEFTAEAQILKRLIFRASGGGGDIQGGTLRDLDFDGDNRTDLISDSLSTADDDGLFFANVDAGFRILTWPGWDRKQQGFLDLLFGYQYWKERYVATKAVQIFPATGPFDEQGKALTEDFKWSSLRIGARGEVPLPFALSFRGGLFLIPWSHFVLDDIHHLRTDLRQDPSVRATGNGGFGVQLDVALSYNIWAGLSVEAGYQYWKFDSGDGDVTFRNVTGGDAVQPFNGATSTRHGAILGVNYRFRL